MARVRDFTIISQYVTANVETLVTIPIATNTLEVQIADTEDPSGTAANGRLAFEAGETADGGNFLNVDPDWWPEAEVRFPTNTALYLRSAIDNTFKVICGQGN